MCIRDSRDSVDLVWRQRHVPQLVSLILKEIKMASNINRLVRKLREITHRYSKPHIEMTPMVKLSLMALRIYLLLIVGLIVYKFIVTLSCLLYTSDAADD